jgi:hypothetical protein
MLCDKCYAIGMMTMLTIVNVERVQFQGHKVFEMQLQCPHCNSESQWIGFTPKDLYEKEKRPVKGEPS